jgi:hypothetical protein
MRAELEHLMRQIQENKRNDWRLELNEPIRGWISGSVEGQHDDERIPVWIEDLSDRGLGVRTAQPLSVHENLQLTFRWHGRSLTVRGRVAWVKLPEESVEPVKYAYGIALATEDHDQLETQRELIQRMIAIISERQRSFESMVNRVRRRTSKNN